MPTSNPNCKIANPIIICIEIQNTNTIESLILKYDLAAQKKIYVSISMLFGWRKEVDPLSVIDAFRWHRYCKSRIQMGFLHACVYVVVSTKCLYLSSK